MKIYTKKGDKGQSSLANGQRLTKSNRIFEQIGSLDELSADLGLVLVSQELDQSDRQLLTIAQENLLSIGGLLAKPAPIIANRLQTEVNEEATEQLASRIDQHDTKLPPLENFILPGGVELAARLHRARVSCRRAERLVSASDLPLPVKAYLNRLSDYLFVLARVANQQAGCPDVVWKRD